ncbi:uncharacterized protein B0I36DRAFT_377271 [Microdochium trichocladiopsis]|uniref:BZIP domain-containing protein n=1 Tax=Microdochium trichocladiopsis TaxID=1682393 RepID=A0A9P8XWD5_9PEZI|nr:uncharacterized protein B0I36DRAFT_377271 [Microdochium trichocladiopsis]KAH7021408.1 hypothetical protein B0I36DRAFT_377271 [Microdochium trichocladiopsis]
MHIQHPNPQGVSCQLARMPQLAEATNNDEDWTGIADAATRRKIQTRLNMRAMRRRKAEQAKLAQQTQQRQRDSPIDDSASQMVPCWDETEQRIVLLPPSTASTLPTKRGLCLPSNMRESKSTITTTATATILLPLSSDHLIPLLQYNVLRGMLTNRAILNRLAGFSGVQNWSCNIDSLGVQPLLSATTTSSPMALPPSLVPTALQRRTPHKDWLDMIPHPRWRDNLLRGLGSFDEGALWSDTIGGLFQGFPHSEVQARGVVAWSPPWHVSGWEVSEGFWRKWAWSFQGCEDVLEATNRWRARRGEEPLVWAIA